MAKNNITDLTFTPSNGWLDKTAYPTYYTDESHVRKTLQKPLDQIKEYLNATLNETLSSETADAEGARVIGMSALYEGDTSGASVADKLKKLRQDYEGLINLSIPDNSLSASKIAAGAVIGEKLAAGAVTVEKLSSDLSRSISSAELSRYDFMGTLIGLQQANSSSMTYGIPVKRICFDSFVNTSKMDSQNSLATVNTSTKRLTVKADASVEPFDSKSGNSTTLNISSNKSLCMVITAQPKMILKGISLSISDIGVASYVTAKLVVKSVDSSNIPIGEVLSESAVKSLGEYSDESFTLINPLTLNEGEKYALIIEFYFSSSTYVKFLTYSLSGGMLVTGMLGTTSEGMTTWSNVKLPYKIKVIRGWTHPSIYTSTDQKLTDNVSQASLYLRKTSGITATPSIAMYSSGDTPTFAEMTKDTSYTPYDFPDGSIEEKWDYTNSAPENLAKVKIAFSDDGTENQYIKSYGVIFK